MTGIRIERTDDGVRVWLDEAVQAYDEYEYLDESLDEPPPEPTFFMTEALASSEERES